MYSTCSMNPIEDEAVIASILLKTQGSVRIVDTSKLLPLLKRQNGLSNWKVIFKV